MKSNLRLLCLLATIALGCGGGDGPSGDEAVIDLPDADAETLCQEFHQAACSGPLGDDEACATSCRDTCTDPGTAELIREQCVAPITVDQVRECGTEAGENGEAAFEVCSSGGGCMFDVFDVTC